MSDKKIVEMPKTVKINIEGWNYKDFITFGRTMGSDIFGAFKMAQAIIVEWGYDVDPHEDMALAKLPIGEGGKVLRTINNMIEQALETMSVGDVKVDFVKAGWSFIDMHEFTTAFAEGDYPTIERKLHEVCTVDGIKKGDTLPLVEGATMVKALRKHYQDVLSGKY